MTETTPTLNEQIAMVELLMDGTLLVMPQRHDWVALLASLERLKAAQDPKLKKPCRVVGGTIQAGVSVRTLVLMAERAYEFYPPGTHLRISTDAEVEEIERKFNALVKFASDGEFIEKHQMDEEPFMGPYIQALSELTARRAYSKASCAALIAEAWVRGFGEGRLKLLPRETETGEGE